MLIDFSCATCGARGGNLISAFPEFSVAGYDEVVLWSQMADEIPSVDKNNYWLLAEKAPAIGEKKVVSVCHPFRETLNTEFWTLFKPARSAQDGWSVNVEEIKFSAFVKCCAIKILEKSDLRAWLQVEVTDLLTLRDTRERLPAVDEENPLFRRLYSFENCQLISDGKFQYYFGDSQGDLGNWLVLERVSGNVHVLALGEWNYHQFSSFSGNIVLNEKTYDNILIRCLS